MHPVFQEAIHSGYDPAQGPLENADRWLTRSRVREQERRRHAANFARMQHSIDEFAKQQDTAAWRAVPGKVAQLLKQAVSVWPQVLEYELNPGQVLWWQPRTAKLATATPTAMQPLWVPVKQAKGLLEPVADVISGIQTPFGGPNPLTATLTGSLLLGGLGYGTGALLDRLLPKKHFSQRGLRRTLGLAGLGIGAVPGLWMGAHNPGGILSKFPWHKEGRLGGSLGANGVFAETIPVDAFNNAVWNDVAVAPSRFGTRSSWGNNEQRLYTPPMAAAAVTGAVTGAGTLSGKSTVSPWDVATAGVAMGASGLLGGLAAGKLLGALAGMKPESQAKLQQAGLWGGLITGAAKALLGQL